MILPVARMCMDVESDPYSGYFPASAGNRPHIPISAFIITFNEEDRLPATLRSLAGLADEIIVVDSGSTDRTREVAAAFGARVIVSTPFPGYGPQKRLAEDACRNPWVLNLDADEELSPDLRETIRKQFERPVQAAAAYRLKIVDMLPGERQPPRFGYSVSPIRLYRKDYYRYSPSLVHDRVEFPRNGTAPLLRGAVRHRSVRSFSAQLKKLARYSDMQAVDAERQGRAVPAFRLVTEFPLGFCRSYFLRRYCLRGLPGFLASVNYAAFRYMRIVQIYERARFKASARRDALDSGRTRKS